MIINILKSDLIVKSFLRYLYMYFYFVIAKKCLFLLREVDKLLINEVYNSNSVKDKIIYIMKGKIIQVYIIFLTILDMFSIVSILEFQNKLRWLNLDLPQIFYFYVCFLLIPLYFINLFVFMFCYFSKSKMNMTFTILYFVNTLILSLLAFYSAIFLYEITDGNLLTLIFR